MTSIDALAFAIQTSIYLIAFTIEAIRQSIFASRVGATREMVHRILKELKKGGYISIEGKHITIEKKLPPGW